MNKLLLTIDGVVNLIIGILLLLFPIGMNSLLGLPDPGHCFYSTILGAVLTGIGIALLIELKSQNSRISGLGFEGAIVINFIGAGALILLLMLKPWSIPLRGQIILWTIVVVVFVIGLLELIFRKKDKV